MQAYTADRYGGPEVLALTEIAVPEPASGQVRLSVLAASVNPLDWHQLRGEPWLVRITGGLRRPKQPVIGTDVAGIVDAVGEGVDGLHVGDRVFGAGIGTFAPFALAAAKRLAVAPDGIEPPAAASLPIAGCTALQAIRRSDIGPGSNVLIVGASGGVGTLAVQLAVAAGASVVGVCSTRNVELVRSLGASEVVDHTTGELDALSGPFDAIIDNVGSLPFTRCKRLLVDGGRYVVVGGPDGGRLLGPLTHLARAKLTFTTGGRRAVPFLAAIEPDDLSELARQVATGSLRPVIEHTFGTHDVADAIRHVETKRTRGKVVIADTAMWPERRRH
jgi:NADPH:quinone reductase-like Zn-dependent oxidoreductase